MKKTLLGIMTALGIFAISMVPVSAATIKNGDEIEIDTDVKDDLFATGGMVDVEKNVNEDAFIFGGQVTVDGDIHEDLIVAAGEVNINGHIYGDVIVAGGTVTINNKVDKDVVVAGGQVRIKSLSEVKGDVVSAGGDIQIEGTVQGEVYAYAGMVSVSGTIMKNVELKADQVDIKGTIEGNAEISAREEFNMDDDAVIKGNLNYWTKSQNDAKYKDMVTGKIAYKDALKMTMGSGVKTGKTFTGFLSLFLSLMRDAVILVLLVWLVKKVFKRAAQFVEEKPLHSLGLGALYFVLIPVIFIILMLTVIGIPLGILVLILYVFSLIFIKPLIAVIAARYLDKKYNKKWNEWAIFGVALGILLIFRILKFIPYIKTLTSMAVLVAALAAVGATLAVLYSKVRNENKK